MVVEQPTSEHLIVDLVGKDLAFEVVSVFGDSCLVLFIELHLQIYGLLLIVTFESHTIEIQSLAWCQIDVVTLFPEGQFDGVLSRKLLVANFDKQSDHFADLMVDEALSDQGESNKAQTMFTSFLFRGESFLEISVDDFLLYDFSLHGHHVSFASWVGLFVSFGEVVVIVGTQIELAEIVELAQQLLPFQLIQHAVLLLFGQEQAHGCDVVVHSRCGIMTHVKAFPYSLYAKNADIEGQLSIDVFGSFLQVNSLVLPVDDVSVVELEAGRYAIAQSMDTLICPSGTRPLNPTQVALISLEDEAIITQHLMQDILDSIGSIPLVLQSQEFLAIVAEEDTHLHLQALAAALSGLFLLFPDLFACLGGRVVGLHMQKNNVDHYNIGHI